jgi:hypothetical protein
LILVQVYFVRVVCKIFDISPLKQGLINKYYNGIKHYIFARDKKKVKNTKIKILHI